MTLVGVWIETLATVETSPMGPVAIPLVWGKMAVMDSLDLLGVREGVALATQHTGLA